MISNQRRAIAPRSPECLCIQASIPGSRLTELGNRIRPMGKSLIRSLLQHRIAFRFELVSWFPFRKLVAIGYFVTNFEYDLNILYGAREIPIGTNFVGDLVVICRVIFV